MESKLKFAGKDQWEFYSKLKERVDCYFKEKGMSPFANGFMVFKIIFYLSIFIGTYLFLILGNYNLLTHFLLWFILGLFTAFVGVNVCHDASHGAISRYNSINAVLGYLFNLVGANVYLWDITHNKIHHTFTNIFKYDGDVDAIPLTRLTPHHKRYSIQKFQHIYAFFLYGLASLNWVFIKDYRFFFKERIGNYASKKHLFSEFIILIVSKIVYYFLFLVLPFMFIEFPWWAILSGFVIAHLIEGFSLAIIIQLAHLLDNLEFPVPNDKGEIENSWAVHQLYTTADYARNNPLVGFFFGGLNFHIEHHLFLTICHVHHRPLSDIVKRTAQEYNIPYFDFPTLGGAISSHIRFLKMMGKSAAI